MRQRIANLLYLNQPNGSGGGGGTDREIMAETFHKEEKWEDNQEISSVLMLSTEEAYADRRQLNNTSNKMLGCED